MTKANALAAAAILLASSPALAWDGTDADSGAAIFIGKGNLCRSGRMIEMHINGQPRNVMVVSIYSRKPDTVLEYQTEDGALHTAIMEGYRAKKARKKAGR